MSDITTLNRDDLMRLFLNHVCGWICSIRSIVCLNLPSFSGGLNPWGRPNKKKLHEVSFDFLLSILRMSCFCIDFIFVV